MTIKQRIEVFIEQQGIKRSVFEKNCGLSNAYIRNLTATPGASVIENILKAYPKLNRVWLLSGEGEMLKDSSTNISEVSGDGNTIGMTVTQTIENNNGHNSGRDINSSPNRMFLDEILAQRKITEMAQMQLATAQSQITELININRAQFEKFTSLLENITRR